jgi:hypothetical protein
MNANTRAALCLMTALATTSLLSACSTSTAFSVAGAAACYGPVLAINAENANDIAAACTQASQQTRPSVSAITNAAFHAGVAERVLGERYRDASDPAEANRHFEAAANLLQRATSLAPATTSGRPRSPAKSDAMLELARVRYGQGNYQAALAQIDELLRLEANPESAIHASAHYLRGLTLEADGQSFAALTDWGVLVDDALDRHTDATDARWRIIGVATKLGVEALNRNNRADAQSAIDLFVRAQDAAEADDGNLQWPVRYDANNLVEEADIFINLGRARMAMAGFNSSDGFADFACAADVAAPELLSLARADFVSATDQAPNNHRAWRWRSCAELALGQTNAAVASAEHAARHAPATGTERAEVFQTLGRARNKSNSLTGAAEAYEEARRHAPAGTPLLGSILMELADAYESSHQSPFARERLLEAVNGDPSNALANVRLGTNYFAPEELQHDYLNAQRYLREAERLTDPRDTLHDTDPHERDRTIRAQALYYLSRLSIEWPGHYNGQAAVTYADEAFQLDGTSENRAQACLARVRAGNIGASTPTQGYCSAIGQAAPSADGYVYEGVYYLRRAQYVRGGEKNRMLDSAYRAFTEGLRILRPGSNRRVQARLLQGQATAQYCIGFAQVGHDQEASIARTIGGDPSEAQDIARLAHEFFDAYRVMTCDGSEHAH